MKGRAKLNMKKTSLALLITGLLLITFFNACFPVNSQVIESKTVAQNDSQYWALLIGTDPKAHCQNDSIDMYNALVDNGWDENNIKKLTETSATKSNFFNKMEWLASNERSDDVVLFFFSGHGGRRSITFYEPYRKTYNVDAVYLSTLIEYFAPLDSNRVILIFDTCNSGSLDRSASPLIRSNVCQTTFENSDIITSYDDIDEEYDGIFRGLAQDGRIILTSCKNNEISYGSDEYGNGFFSYHLINGFNGAADSNSNGWVSAEEAFDYAEKRTIKDTRWNLGARTQHPQKYDGCSGQVEVTQTNYLGGSPPEFNVFHKFLSLRQRLIPLFKKILRL